MAPGKGVGQIPKPRRAVSELVFTTVVPFKTNIPRLKIGRSQRRSWFFLFRVVRRVHVVVYERPHAMQLHNGLTYAGGEVTHLFGHESKGPCGQFLQRSRIELVAHAHQEGSLDHGDAFVLRMPMSLDSVSV